MYDSSLWVARILAARLFIPVWKSSHFNKWYPIHFVYLCKASEPSLVTSTCLNEWKLCHCTPMKEFKASEASDCNPWFLHNFKQSKWQVNINSVDGCLRSCLWRCKCKPPPSCSGVQQWWSAHPAGRASSPGLTICVLQSRLLPGSLPATFVFRDSLMHVYPVA